VVIVKSWRSGADVRSDRPLGGPTTRSWREVDGFVSPQNGPDLAIPNGQDFYHGLLEESAKMGEVFAELLQVGSLKSTMVCDLREMWSWRNPVMHQGRETSCEKAGWILQHVIDFIESK